MNYFLPEFLLNPKVPEGKSKTAQRKPQKMKGKQIFIWRLQFAFCLLLLILTEIAFAQEKAIEPGDVLEIVVFGHQELSRTLTVGPSGTVDFPFLQGLPVNGLALKDVRDMITAQLSKYIPERPIVTVSEVRSYTIPVTVLGQVNTPGEHQIAVNATVQGALVAAGGTTHGAQLDKIRIFSREATNGDFTEVNLLDFFNKANPRLLPPLKEGDVIVVPGHPLSLGAYDLKVLGEVHNPGPYTAYQGVNLLDLLFIAGGPTAEADLRKTRILSPYNSKAGDRQKEVDLDKLLTAKEFEQIPLISPGDIVYLPKKKSSFGRVFLSVARDVVSLGSLLLILERVYNAVNSSNSGQKK
jgi:protein involved in polysaccharide export with SLBB domain